MSETQEQPASNAASGIDEIARLNAENEALASAKAVLEEELAEARKTIDTLNARIAKAEAKASITPKAARAPKPRVAGPIKEPVAGAELRALLKSEAVEIVYSDGRREIISLPALQVAGDAWQELSGERHVLREPQVISAAQRVDLAGFALFDKDGAQIGWCPLPSPIPLAPGQQHRIDRQILFG